MTGNYNPYLVILSIAIAVIASYTALDLANRVSESEGNARKAWLWLIAGATSLGTGIWAMHFIGMLAFHLPIPVAYDLELTGLSMLIAVAVSAVALFVLRQRHVTLNGRLTAAALMGAGIAAMHYTGMMAMRMSPGIAYDPLLFITSILIAFGGGAATVNAIMSFAREVGVGVIAQGVETEEQRSLLEQASAESWAQGFHFSEAVSAGDAAQLLRVGRIQPEVKLAHLSSSRRSLSIGK